MTIEFKYGLGIGASVCVWILLQYAFGLHTSNLAIGALTGYLSNLIPAVGLWFLLRKKQSEIWDGTLTFGRGLWAGAQASLVAALVGYCFLTIYHTFINPGWIDGTLEWKVAQMRAAAVDELTIREHIVTLRSAYTPTGLALSTIVGTTLTGCLLTWVITLALRFLPKPATR